MGHLIRLLLVIYSLIIAGNCAATTKRPNVDAICDESRPVECSTERPDPADCPPERVQRWFPQSDNGVPFACGACYYCKPRPSEVEKDDCPEIECEAISPSCNKVEPLFIVNNGRRCKGCSKCLSYNECPELNCPRRRNRCEIYGPNFKYYNGHICPDCEVCLRYKGTFERPEATPLPCPQFNRSECHINNDLCLEYEDRFVNMGENRTCQVCPTCKEWADPNGSIMEIDLGGSGRKKSIPNCPTATNCALPDNCAASTQVYGISESGETCRECDRCTEVGTTPRSTGGADRAGDGPQKPPTAPAITQFDQSCPILLNCPVMTDCDGRIVNTTTTLKNGVVCPSCQVCEGSATMNNTCPPITCPGGWCRRTAVYKDSVNGEYCPVCVCVDANQDCSGFPCPSASCSEKMNVSVIHGDKMCPCQVCKPTTRGTTANSRGDTASVTAPTTAANTAHPDKAGDARPDTSEVNPRNKLRCDFLISNLICPSIGSCPTTLVVTDLITINGTECTGCPRCATDVQAVTDCPRFNCSRVNCQDTEDIALGRRYRVSEKWRINNKICDGCDTCLNCPIVQCPPLNLACSRYTRNVDSKGCPICPVCEQWANSNGPPITNQNGFVQSVSTGLCIKGSSIPLISPGITVDQCRYDLNIDDQQQVWRFSNDGTIKDENTGLCISHMSQQKPFIMQICDSSNDNMIWELEKHGRYPQFFRIKHRKSRLCLDVLGQSSTAFSTPFQLSSCEEFTRDSDGLWSDQWWRFDQYQPDTDEI